VRQGTTIVRQRVAGVMMAAAAGVTVLALPWSASAHTDLADTVPAAGSVSRDPVKDVSLEFAAPILPELTAVVVTRGGTGVQIDEPVVEGSTVNATVDGAAQPGEYTVAYRTVAADGHPITGSFSFEVASRPASAAPARPRRDAGAASTRRRGAGAATASDAAQRGDAATAADPGPAQTGRESQSQLETAPSTDAEPIRLGVIGLLGAGAAAVAVGAGLLRRRSLS